MKNKYIDTVKIGAKGQIVIPKEVRDMFGVQAGDSLILLADAEKGIAIQTVDVFNKIADAVFDNERLLKAKLQSSEVDKEV